MCSVEVDGIPRALSIRVWLSRPFAFSRRFTRFRSSSSVHNRSAFVGSIACRELTQDC